MSREAERMITGAGVLVEDVAKRLGVVGEAIVTESTEEFSMLQAGLGHER
jgi:hypothetical protein